MYKTIYIPVDNSDHSNTAVDVGVHMAKIFGSKIVGSHVYAAKMHEYFYAIATVADMQERKTATSPKVAEVVTVE